MLSNNLISVFKRSKVVKFRLEPFGIIKLYIILNRIYNVFFSSKIINIHKFRFQMTKKAFYTCIVPAVCFPRHTYFHIELFKIVIVFVGCILMSLITMYED